MANYNNRLIRKQKDFAGTFTQQPEERRINPLLERLQDQFVVKQCNHPGLDSAAIQPVFKLTPIPALETREAAGCLTL